MRLSAGVEWGVHCTWLLALAPPGGALSTRRLAEFYDLPEAYLGKVLQSLARAGVVHGSTGPRGGFRLARPAASITVADVVEAVEGTTPVFRCTEIRQRGPVPLTGAACRRPCGVAQVMTRAEQAWRRELAATTIADLVTSAPDGVDRARRWLEGGDGDGAATA